VVVTSKAARECALKLIERRRRDPVQPALLAPLPLLPRLEGMFFNRRVTVEDRRYPITDE